MGSLSSGTGITSQAEKIQSGPSNSDVFVDLRVVKGKIWNYGDWRYGEDHQHEHDPDYFLYHGFRTRGQDFLRNVNGRFGAAYHDEDADVIFLCRDWVGEVPLHYYLTDSSLIAANRISDIQNYLGADFSYEFVRVVPQSHVLIIDAAEQYEFDRKIRKTWNVRERALYYDFSHDDVGEWLEDSDAILEDAINAIRSGLERSVQRRLSTASLDNQRPAILLSGGIDSLSVAYFLSQCEPRTVAYTLSIGKGGSDVERARLVAEHFGLEFRIVRLEPDNVIGQYFDAVRESELYHLANVYCAVGMVTLANTLREHGISTAFCGEGVNEALGDYHDWVVKDPRTGSNVVLQRVDHERMSTRNGRLRYIWGREHKEGRFNLQLGSGLAKHGIGRMVKPMLSAGINLECPYLDRNVMRYLVSIPKKRLDGIGGKPGLMCKVFQKEIESGAIPKEFITESEKIRLQDSSDLGERGISPILIAAGFDQKKTIMIFNSLFGARMTPDADAMRLSLCSGS
jgi:asparagine synthetase B (glutamine-hydrolysing)